ncbi:hypothetical protein FSARC_4447 [Fusarium sarcochroum]|uniref:Uncharacterized protein n=1 Tax=Fusarium sarcochroum TaxID=1208366 RepID=A0A8H4U1M3_9HYPO|nr:hypothetical protein FSARC_4447 [Fusarium sarcochroum]
MGLFSKTLRRRRHRANQDVDLLSAAFGLPFRRGLGLGGDKSPHRMAVVYDSDDEHESESEAGYSSSSEDDYGHHQHTRRVSERPSTPHPLPPSSPSSSSKTSPKKRHRRRHHPKSPSLSSSRRSPRHHVSRSASRRSNIENRPIPLPISHIRPSATFPPRIPIHLSNPPCNIVQSSTFPMSSLNQSFVAPVSQPQQQVYYPNHLTYVPHQPSPLVRVQTPQYITTPVTRPVAARPPPSGPPAVSVPLATSGNTRNPPREEKVRQPMPSSLNDHGHGLSEPFAKEVQRIQKHIEAKMADLAEEPTSRILRRDLRRLQDRLNSTLNKAIASGERSHERQPSFSTFSNFSQSVGDQDAANSDALTPARGVAEHVQVAEKQLQRELQAQRDESPQRILRHHFCTGCGNIRSLLFHKRYPPTFRERRKPNLCESCREERFKRGVAHMYHFCFNCGSARSKEFHKQHPVLPGEPILANYCGSCTTELKADGSIPETSVVGLNPRVKTHQAIPPGSDSDEDLNSLTANHHRNYKDGQTKPRSGQEQAVYPHKYASDDENVRGRRPEPRDLRSSIASPEIGIASPASTYCLSRNTGSSDRRAERKSSGHFSAEPSPHREEVKVPGNYQAPYIEDSLSAPHSRRGTPGPVFDHTRADWKGKQREFESVKTLTPELGLKSALANERSSSDGSRKARDETPKESPRPREKSLESDRSDPSSSKSSSSKTVRFKQSVDIRTTLPSDGDAEFSEAETPCLRSSGSPLISRKKPTLYKGYGYEEEQSTNRYLHPHYGQQPMKSPGSYHEHLRTPDSFRSGTPSKGYSQGAFSKEFDQAEDWDSFRSPRYPYTDQYSDGNSFHGYYEADEGFQEPAPKTRDYTHQEKYMESTASLPSYLSSGGGFSSFFKNFTDEGSAFEKSSGQAGSNPYYTPRKRRFPDFSFCHSPVRSEKSAKREHEQSSPAQPDNFLWKNAFNPIPTVEEASSLGDFSPESPNDLLEYNVIADISSSVESEGDEEPSDRDTSEEDSEENTSAHEKMLSHTTWDSPVA